MARPPVRLILHAGSGKTGTSSIQATLRDARHTLEAQGVWYLGLVLEHAPVQRHAWQKFGETARLHALPHAEGADQLHGVLVATVALAIERRIHTLIWSSESLFDRPDKAIEAMHRLDPAQVDRHVVIYVRRHDAWASSAYLQWGIRHKTYRGRLLRFAHWAERRGVRFQPNIQRFTEAFPGKVTLRNFDHVRNAVADFLLICRIDAQGVEEQRENITADDNELYLRALFNDQADEPQLPAAFNRSIGRRLKEDAAPEAFLQALLTGAAPHADAIHADRLLVNQWLLASGCEPLHEQPALTHTVQIDRARLVLHLATLAMDQAVRLARLEALRTARTAGTAATT
ncbi:hypothetical protein LRH25_22695 [Ideonella azotifigens]|uniref:Uncharacterized protein n=1 Tax=Ideonella azotifigens TaxID=513160 RepID=A0ABN1KCG4_9BURK|nr:hypothetical protein [Ideonella azotifigens]MCD2343140.1 hypothetical protein [Ideonella azotifigens]